jgi:RNA polymerase sigma-70 factor (ECF subfamily)
LKDSLTITGGACMHSEASPPLLTASVDEPAPLGAAPLEAAAKLRLAALLRAHFGTVRRFVRRFGVPDAASDDAAQEVFIVAARRLREIEPGGERAYLYGVALRVAANARRALANQREQPSSAVLARAVSDAPEPDAQLETKRLRALLDEVLDMLPEDLRTAFVLFELEGFSVPEIAELCGIPQGTAASRLRRAREAFQAEAARLKAELQRSGEGP